MKIVMLSNFLNHHQLSLCQELARLTDNNFYFIAIEKMPEERRLLGYQNYTDFPFFIQYTEEKKKLIESLIIESDALICGSVPDSFFVPRVKARKLTFRYFERVFKTPFTIKNTLHRIGSMLVHFIRYQNQTQYLLCASAFTALDISRFGCFHNRLYKWGYFPEAKKYEDMTDLISRKKHNSILWCGRMIDWKHPEAAVELAKRLRNSNFSFTLDFIGIGDLENRLRKFVQNEGLDDFVHFHCSMTPDEVREYMENASIYLMTSNRREGWGAVVNEAMNSGCAVVGSHIVGSIPYLIQDKKNGLIYRSGDMEDLYSKVVYLLEHPEKRKQIGLEAYRTITGLWNAETAAQRFVNVCSHILNGEKSPDLYEFGPCSKAEIIKNNYYN